jgi:predicted Co/Zn/Cd cation transporter (cation efflux family)
MGEHRAELESIESNQFGDAYVVIDGHLSIADNIVCLLSFHVDKLIYVHTQPFWYNKCKFASSLEAQLKPLKESHYA